MKNKFRYVVAISVICMLMLLSLPVTVGNEIISTEICGNKNGEYTIQIARDNAEKVKLLLDDIEKRLDKIDTEHEAIKIFNDAITKLYNYGLFDDLSVEEIQRMVYGRFTNPILRKVAENYYLENQASDNNYLCLIAGRTDKTQFLSRHTSASETVMLAIDELKAKMYTLISNLPIVGWSLLILYDLIFGRFEVPLYYVWAYGHELSIINPLAIGHLIYFGDYSENETIPAEGWISTVGINGEKSWSNGIIGQISTLPISWTYKKWHSEIYPGVAGFTGIKLSIDDEIFFFGSALRVSISQ